MLYGETIGNPSLDVLDISAVADVANAAGVPLVVDNTFATPWLCRPIEHGAHLVTHSATKWLGGHGTTLGGVLIDAGTFPWDSAKFPGLTEPSEGYRGLRFVETFGNFAFIMKARVETMRDLGPTLSPFNAFMLLQGLETLSLRMDRHVANALALAQMLDAHPKVEWVDYPDLAGNPSAELAARYLPRGAGAVLTFGIGGGRAGGARFIEALELCSHLANVGDAKTLVIHPASTTHRRLDADALVAAGVREDMIRVSVGIETLEDILWDVERALGIATT
jgi:O-acetylhomoserine (thiol)-lyase